MYVAGTRTAHDWMLDTYIPLGMTDQLDRYRDLTEYLDTVGARRAVGHSMGGSVVLEAARHYPDLTTTTYGAPVFFGSKGGDRHRDTFDPVSIFDTGAIDHGVRIPHSYKGPGT